MLTDQKRTATQRGSPGAPAHPTTPSKSVRPKRGRPAGPQPPRLPRDLFNARPVPRLDAATRLLISTLIDPAHRVASASGYIMRAIAAGATTEEIEGEIGLSPGSLVAELIADRFLLLRWASALVERAEGFDRRAQTLLAAVAGGAVRTPAVRATLDYSNTLRCGAESARRHSEAILRKATLTADKDALQAKARVQRVFDVVSGAANCTLPVTARELVVTSDDPLDGAQQLLPQLQAALAEATGGQRRYLGDCMRRVEQYLRRREEPAAPAAAGPACQPSVGLTASHMTATPSEQPAAREVEPPTETPEIAELRDSARRAMYALDQARLTGRPTRYLEREVRKRSTALYEALRRQFDDLVSRSEQAVGDEKAQLDKTADQLAAEIVDLEDELGEAPMQNP